MRLCLLFLDVPTFSYHTTSSSTLSSSNHTPFSPQTTERHHQIRVPGFASTDDIGKLPAFNSGTAPPATSSSSAAASNAAAGGAGKEKEKEKGKEKAVEEEVDVKEPEAEFSDGDEESERGSDSGEDMEIEE